MPKRTKAEAVKLIRDCAILYSKNLANKNVLFITSHDGITSGFEAQFMPQNYMHLTGVSSRLKSVLFYQSAINNRLSVNDITLSPDGKTEQKLDVLPQLMNIHILARMIGDYDNHRPLLVADRFAGTVAMAMGFVRINNGLYVPSTSLKMDVRDITTQATRRRVVSIFIKPRREALYKQLTYIAKGVTINDINLLPILREKVDLEDLTATFPI